MSAKCAGGTARGCRECVVLTDRSLELLAFSTRGMQGAFEQRCHKVHGFGSPNQTSDPAGNRNLSNIVAE